MAKREMELDLLDNALDYVQSAVEHANSDSPKSWKYAILHLFAGVELLLKARLREEHWTLLFSDVDRASKSAMAAGDFLSVDFKACCKRLAEVAGVTISKATMDKLESLRKLRNRIQHFDVSLTEEEVKSNLVVGLEFVDKFCVDQFDESVLPEEIMRQIRTGLIAFDAYVNHRMASIEEEMDASRRYFVCPNCQQEAVDVADGDPKCLFCQATPTSDELLRQIARPANIGDWVDIQLCPTCRKEMCVQEDDGNWVCTSCGEGGRYDQCPECNRLIDLEDGICDECLRDKVNRAD